MFQEITRHETIGQAALSDHSMARIVNKVVGTVGLQASDFSGHSLRAGFITEALDRGVDYSTIMKQSGRRKSDRRRVSRQACLWSLVEESNGPCVVGIAALLDSNDVRKTNKSAFAQKASRYRLVRAGPPARAGRLRSAISTIPSR